MSEPIDTADEVLAYLLAGATPPLGSHPVSAEWPIFVPFMPASPNSAIQIMQTTGRNDGRLMATSERIMHHGIQIIVRGSDYVATARKMQAIVSFCEQIRNTETEIDGIVYRVNAMTRMSGPVYLGEEPDTRRSLLSVNFLISYVQITEA